MKAATATAPGPDPLIQFLTLVSQLSEPKSRKGIPLPEGERRALVEALPVKVRESARAALEMGGGAQKKAKDALAEAILRTHLDVLETMEEILGAAAEDFTRARWARALEHLDRGNAILELIPGKRASFYRSLFAVFKEMALGQQKHLEKGDAESLGEAVKHHSRARRLAQDLMQTIPVEGRNAGFERMLIGLQLQCHFAECALARQRSDKREAQRLDAEFPLLIRDVQSRLGPADEMVPTLVALAAMPEGLGSFQRSAATAGAFDFETAQQQAAQAKAALRSFTDAFQKSRDENVLLGPMTEFFTCMLEALDVNELTLRTISRALVESAVKTDVTSLRDSSKKLQHAADRMATLKDRMPAGFVTSVENVSGVFTVLQQRLTNLTAVLNSAGGRRSDLTGSFERAASGYEFLEEPSRRFLKDHPDIARNVFIMTPYHKAVANVIEALEEALRKAGLNPLRADGKNYLKDRNLWHNVCVYMLCCGSGVAVLEHEARREFNPNVALEYGFMRALDKRVLLLTEKNFKAIRADIGGIVRETFDVRRPQSVVAAVSRWLRDFEKPAAAKKLSGARKKR